MRNENREALVLGALGAVFGRVVPVIINPIKRVFITWFVSHVLEKIIKTVFSKPSITNFNTTTTISLVRPVRFQIAATFHRPIRVVFLFIKVKYKSFPHLGILSLRSYP